MQPGLVSVIVASYNHAEYLKARMDSLINQTYQDIEILVIDDCSIDNSSKLLKKYEKYPKVKLIIREQNGGWVTVSNQGVEMSKGEFIIFANCDDSCEPDLIKKLVKAMHDYPEATISFCKSKMIDQDENVIGDDFLIREKAFRDFCNTDVLIPKKIFRRFLLNSCVIPNLSAALFRKDSYISSGGFDSVYKICADWELFFRIANTSDVYYVSEALNFFRQHDTSIRSSAREFDYFGEILSLLLDQISRQDLFFLEKIKFRFHIMYLWAIQMFLNSFRTNLPLYKIVIKVDITSLFFLPFAILYRALILTVKKLKFGQGIFSSIFR